MMVHLATNISCLKFININTLTHYYLLVSSADNLFQTAWTQIKPDVLDPNCLTLLSMKMYPS